MADPDIDPRLVRQIDDALDSVADAIRQAKEDQAHKRQRAAEQRALGGQLLIFAAEGRALAERWGRIAQARTGARR